MKKTVLCILAVVVTVGAAIYQRKTGPTYSKQLDVTVNDTIYNLKLVRSLGLDERSAVKLSIADTSIKATLYYKKYRSSEEYQETGFVYRTYPVNSFIMNKIFGITRDEGFFAGLPQQPPAGKIQYYIELTDKKGTQLLMNETPVIIRFKGSVPGYILAPHVLIMFLAMLFSTLAGLFAIAKVQSFKKYGKWALGLLIAGGLILGPLVQKFAFGEYWTGIPFGWDLTDNKLLIALIFWIIAVFANRKKEKPLLTALAAAVLLIVYSVPHSLFGSELDYASGEIIQGMIITFLLKIQKKT
jgi:hypothetical protein